MIHDINDYFPAFEVTKMLNYSHISQALEIATPSTCRRRIRSKVRARKLVDVRIALAAMLRERGWTYTEIAAELNRAPSLVHHYVKAHEALWENNAEYSRLFSTLKQVMPSKVICL